MICPIVTLLRYHNWLASIKLLALLTKNFVLPVQQYSSLQLRQIVNKNSKQLATKPFAKWTKSAAGPDAWLVAITIFTLTLTLTRALSYIFHDFYWNFRKSLPFVLGKNPPPEMKCLEGDQVSRRLCFAHEQSLCDRLIAIKHLKRQKGKIKCHTPSTSSLVTTTNPRAVNPTGGPVNRDKSKDWI